MAITYAKAGVHIRSGEELVRRIKRKARSTFSSGVLADIGLFGAFYDASFPQYKHPILVSSVDGVGTKLKIAFALNRYDTIGQDLVHHCVNDIAVCGAVPLFFLDYFSTGKLSPAVAERVIEGFVRACRENRCSLIGGETAEMPGFYAEGEFDIAGMIVGVVDRANIMDGKKIRRGDMLIGLPSTGLHTNGYSLARRILLKKFSLRQHSEMLGKKLGEALLAIHRSYLSAISAALRNGGVHGMSHITGGGIEGNTMRIVPRRLRMKIDWKAWDRPPLFSLIQEAGEVPERDMRRTFNLGIGMVFVVARNAVEGILHALKQKGEEPVIVGEIA